MVLENTPIHEKEIMFRIHIQTELFINKVVISTSHVSHLKDEEKKEKELS